MTIEQAATFEYYFKFREPGIGCQPTKGLLSVHPGKIEFEGHQFWGYAVYDRILDDEEVNRFDIYNVFDILQWEIDAKKQRLMHVLSPLQYKSSALQMNSSDDRYVIIHPSTRPEYKYQISFFDDKGPYSHHSSKDLKDVLQELLSYNYDTTTAQYA